MKESPNWLEMPDELMVNIFQRLPTVEILNSARKVCTTWLEICKYPAIWKVINIPKPHVLGLCWDFCLFSLTREAVDLSCGELIDISIDEFCTDVLLNYIVLRSNKLKRLWLVNCFIRDGAISQAVKRVPQLEELHLSDISINPEDIEVIGRNCPQLKSFKMTFKLSKVFNGRYDDYALAIANNMPELRQLEVNDTEMTNEGLEAILNGCPHLESLDVRMCYNLDLNGYIGKLCMKRIKDFKHRLEENSGFYFRIPDVEHFDEGEMYDDFSEVEMYDDFSESDFFED